MISSEADRVIRIDSRSVQVWAVRLEAPDACLESARGMLSADETARAERFHFARHRQAFVLGRAALRALLGRILGLDPAGIEFHYGAKGKPGLADPASPLRFNASNSGDLAVYAFTLECPVGIDVEQLRPIAEIESIARRFFAAEEMDELMSLPAPERTGGFFRCWTRKEAYIKAIGDGLSVPLDSFQVTLSPGAAARMVHLGGSVEEAQHWAMHDFAPAPGYYGAIAYRDRARAVEFHPLVTVQQLLASL